MERALPTSMPQFADGMRHHNDGEYYEAHESWEELWQDEPDDAYRLFLQGLIQVTSAFHKVFFQKQPGSAARLLARGLDKLAPFPDDYLGVALGAFRAGARRWADALERLARTPTALDDLAESDVPPLHLIERATPACP